MNTKKSTPILALFFILLIQQTYAFTREPFTEYTLKFENQWSNSLALGCTRNDDQPSDIQMIIPGQSWGFDFKTDLSNDAKYTCVFIGQKATQVCRADFLAFDADSEFVDDGCGGRNCTWRADGNGVLLFNLNHQQYHLKAPFVCTWN